MRSSILNAVRCWDIGGSLLVGSCRFVTPARYERFQKAGIAVSGMIPAICEQTGWALPIHRLVRLGADGSENRNVNVPAFSFECGSAPFLNDTHLRNRPGI
jgi:hypothetical protein